MKSPFRSLYLKIFGWFWLAMIIINVALTRPTPSRRSWREVAQVGPNAQRAAEIYEQSGAAALTATLQANEKSSGVDATFYDQTGHELSGRNVPAAAGEMIARVGETN